MTDDRNAERDANTPAKTERAGKPERTTSTVLLGGRRELVIEHDGRDYRLRITHQGKLILTA